MNNKNYSIGLDIGTESVGWAVINDNYKLNKIKGKNMWGAHLFEGANTASKRRLSRSTRRRYNKRRERIRLLKLLMNDMIMDVDDSFFIRMENLSFLDKEDKWIVANKKNIKRGVYNLFIDSNYNDKDFYKEYKTIYHLRNELCKTKEKMDPRLIYLALHHIVKYRGNFLNEGQSYSLDNSNIKDKINKMFTTIFDTTQLSYEVTNDKLDQITLILKETKSKSLKAQELLELFDYRKEDKQIINQITLAIVGNSFNVSKLFSTDNISYEGKDIKLKFSEAKYDDDINKYENEIGERIEEISLMKDIFSWVELQGILDECDDEMISVSKAMITRYNKHKDDLALLKNVIKNKYPKEYNKVFKAKVKKLNNYYNYINHPKDTSTDNFYKFLKTIIKDPDNKDELYILEKIELEKFLLKQNDRSNGAIPYQLNLDEMIKIIDNQAKYYPSLAKNKEKLISILEFRIPYYYGPLNPNNRDFSWIIKQPGKENERILPWNHEDIVDVDATAEAFIQKMTNYCTYFTDQKVLPKNSLIVCKYEVLSELNKIRIDDKLIDIGLKNRVFDNLFMKHKKISDKTFKKWLKEHGELQNNDNCIIRGYQKEDAFSSSLTPWYDFTKIFGEINDNNFQLIENIIYDITIFSDKKILEKRLKYIYKLSKSQINKIIKLNYSGWSRLSKKLLIDIKSKYKEKEGCSIIDVMELSNMTLMEIINTKSLSFKKQIEDANKKEVNTKFNLNEVLELQGSPALKKGIWQSLQIVEEITKIMKKEPENVYIEFAREEGKKKRTESVVQRLQKIYKDLDLQTKEDLNLRKQINNKDNLKKIDNERLYLYFTQMGKCMYTNDPLDIDKLSMYQVDHIIPRSIIKDDSLDNKVLVISKENQRKLDELVINKEIRDKNIGFWKHLFDIKLISAKKFYSLIKSEYTAKDQEIFINRQLVETRQIIKHVTQLIDNHYTNTNVVTVRANLTHDFRVKYGIYKNRNVNDYHHGHDAYIACIIGQYILNAFPNLDSKYIYGKFKEYTKNKSNLRFNDGFILNSMNNELFNNQTGEVISIDKIKKCFEYKDCFITRKLEEKSGSLFNVTIQPNDKNSEKGQTKASLPVNKYRKNVNKYGGFEGIQYIIYAIRGIKKVGKKETEVNKLIGVPLVYKNKSLEFKEEYIKNTEKLMDVKIIKEIKKNQLIEIDNGMYYITASSELVNAKQLILTNKDNEIIYNIDKKSDEDLIYLYDVLCDKMIKYYPAFNNIANSFISDRDVFIQIDLEIKKEVILQLLKITQANPNNASLQIKGFTIQNKRIGRLSQKTVYLDKTTFIDNSITGIYSKKYKL